MKTTVLMILDGFGINERTEGNAVKLAKTPIIDSLIEKYPYVKGYAKNYTKWSEVKKVVVK